MEYYLYLNNEQKGPLTLAQLQSMWRSGSITGQTLYWQHGFDEWLPLSTMIESLEPPEAPQFRSPAYAPRTAARPAQSDALGVIIMLLPLASAALMWFWISSMNLLQNPSSTLAGIVIVTVIATSALMAVEASQLGMGEKRGGKATTGPVGWFLCGLLLWIVAFPAYLYSRSKFSVKNYLVGGLVSALVFVGVALVLQSTIEQQKASVRRHFEGANERLRDLQRQLERYR
ncbi:MAG: DUF4339 domain-containing protein [Deltaproteobacteria bacterium]|nr:DUF4339 domain-containing protein [Deltaproteobacteria bacterium]